MQKRKKDNFGKFRRRLLALFAAIAVFFVTVSGTLADAGIVFGASVATEAADASDAGTETASTAGSAENNENGRTSNTDSAGNGGSGIPSAAASAGNGGEGLSVAASAQNGEKAAGSSPANAGDAADSANNSDKSDQNTAANGTKKHETTASENAQEKSGTGSAVPSVPAGQADGSGSSAGETSAAQAYTASQTIKENIGGEARTLTVTVRADAGVLPEGAVLKVTPVQKDAAGKQKYNEIQEKLEKEFISENESLTGFLAYDISFEADGAAVEPDGSVLVSMSWDKAVRPEGTEEGDTISVLHFKEDETAPAKTQIVNLTENGENVSGDGQGGASDAEAADTAALLHADGTVTGGMDASENAASDWTKDGTRRKEASQEDDSANAQQADSAVKAAEMSVGSFSVFTITWTVSSSDKTRIGNVSMHYVDVNGLEIDRTATLDPKDLAKTAQSGSNIVKIADWVNNDSSNVRKVSGYVFQKATIGSADGTEITGLKVDTETTGTGESAKTTYKLYYTASTASDLATASDVTWTPYKDGVSGNPAQNADIYLVFKSTAQRVSVHFVDESGNILINPVYQYADKVITNDEGVEVSTWAQTIQNYQFTGRAHMGETGWEGFAFKKIKAVKEGADSATSNITYRFQYKLKDNDTNETWTDLTATDVYLIYRKTNGRKPITVHYTDFSGNALKDEAGNTLTKTIDAADWTSGTWMDLASLADDIDDYEFTSTVNGNNTSQTVIGATSANDLSITEETEGNPTVSLTENFLGSVKGNFFRFIKYTYTQGQEGNGTFQIGRGSISNGTISATRRWNITGNFEIYLTYRKLDGGSSHTYTVHYVDEDGNEIPNSGTTQTTIATAGDTNAVTVNLSEIAKNINGYTANTSVGYLGRATAATGGIPFTSITFTKQTGDTGKWNYSVANGNVNPTSTPKQLNLGNLNIYVTYRVAKATDDARVTVHHIDENGKTIHADTYPDGNGNWTISSTATDSSNAYLYRNKWNGFTRNNTSTYYTSIPGYTFKDIYIGDYKREENKYTNKNKSLKGDAIVWNYKTDENGNNGQWHTGYGATNGKDATQVTAEETPTVTEVYTDNNNTPGYMTDIYVMYSKENVLTLHYVYIGTGNTLNEITQDGLTNPKTGVTPGTKDSPTAISSGDNVKNIDGKVYIGTRIGPSWKTRLTGADLGPNVTQVYAENGQLYYSFNNADAPYSLTRQGSNDIWIYAASSGRRFTLTKGNGDNYTIGDSQHGTFTLNMTSDNTWTATFHGEAETTEYTVTKSTTPQVQEGSTSAAENVDSYQLILRDYIPNSQTDVYELYIDNTNDAAKVWINDDLKYSGYFTVGRNKWIEDRMTGTVADQISSYYYTWNRIVTGSETGKAPLTTTTSTVDRKQTGLHWNIAYNRSDRTWLDIEADEGGLNETTQQSVSYTVTMHYRISEGAWQEVTSEPVAVNYYSLLMNGDFENLSILPSDANVEGRNYVTTNGWGHYYSNERYKENKGVWQTTSPGTGSNVGNDIEIVNVKGTDDESTKNNNYTGASSKSYDWNPDLIYEAAHGDQFAELNAESAGALYQDVVTHPNQHLNYWLSHRARGQMPYTDGTPKNNKEKASTPEYDTMYLVIMPTKLAMTSAQDGGELKNQSDLEAFIDSHGGYDRVRATSVGQGITYKDETNGILIEKVTSNDQFWHKINVPNGYIAKSGLTRFFFVAGPTAWQNDQTSDATDHNNLITEERRNPTHGNFLDNVGFSQVLPDPEGFNLVVTKTFYGLTQAQIAGLVSSDKGNNKFKITITNKVTNSDGQGGWIENSSSTQVNNSLENAVLSYTATETAGSYTFNLTATKDGTNLLTGSNTGDVLLNDDGSVTMTWTFVDQPLMSGGDQAHDQHYDYYATETGADIADYSLTEATTVSPENTNHEGAALVSEGTTARFTFGNTYKSTTDSDQPRIIVTKKFFGLTPSAVDELFGDGYQVKVTNSAGATETLNTDPQNMGSNVTFEKSTDAGHNTTIRWTITGTGWGEGTYKISEERFDTSEYTTSSIQIGTAAMTMETVTKTGSGHSATAGKDNLLVGGTTGAATLTYDNTKNGSEGDDGKLKVDENLSTETNLIIAKYVLSDKVNYLVWTPDPVGASTAQAILNKINNPSTTDSGLGWTDTNTTATTSNTNFRSGDPGTISRGDAKVSYNSETGALSFTNGSGTSWKNYFSAKVTGLDTADLKVENHYNPAVRILKVDSTDNTHVLEGAVFHLYKADNKEHGLIDEGDAKPNIFATEEEEGVGTNTLSQTARRSPSLPNNYHADYYMVSTTKANDYSWDISGATGKKIVEFTTGNDGMVTLPELGQGTYFLEEVTAPSGFTKSIKNDIQFSVDENGTVHLLDSSGKELTDNQNSDNVTLDWEKPYYTITVPNDPTEIQIKKVSSENNNTLLGGASFRIFRMYTANGTSTATKQYYHNSGSGAAWTTEAAGAEVFTTATETRAATTTAAATTLGFVRLPDLATGTYFLEETQAPDGYNMLTGPIAFKIDSTVTLPTADENGKLDGVNVVNAKSNATGPASIDGGTGTPKMYTIIISNTPGVVLPSTGGSGLAMQIFLCGLLFLVLDGIFLMMHRKGVY